LINTENVDYRSCCLAHYKSFDQAVAIALNESMPNYEMVAFGGGSTFGLLRSKTTAIDYQARIRIS